MDTAVQWNCVSRLKGRASEVVVCFFFLSESGWACRGTHSRKLCVYDWLITDVPRPHGMDMSKWWRSIFEKERLDFRVESSKFHVILRLKTCIFSLIHLFTLSVRYPTKTGFWGVRKLISTCWLSSVQVVLTLSVQTAYTQTKDTCSVLTFSNFSTFPGLLSEIPTNYKSN